MNSLGFDKSAEETRVVVAMSGGVDSSTVAALLRDQGYDVVGITLQLYDHGLALAKKGACCAGQDIYDAQQVAAVIGIDHYVLDYESRFKDAVIDDFADSYVRGETPLPCVRCNQSVKFKDLYSVAHDLGADCLATGHYVQRMVGPAGAELRRAADHDKDQSYFLFATTAAQLDYLRFPLGGMRKTEVRALAERYGLAISDKPDSQDICFVPDGRYGDLVSKLRPGAAEPGEIVHLDGRVLGAHNGILHYTIGQRRGIGVGGLAEPIYVLALDADRRQVIVGPREALAAASLSMSECNWLVPARPGDRLRGFAKIRSTTAPEPVTVHIHDSGQADVLFDAPEYGVSPGQACVVYDGDRVLGGGWIKSSKSAFQAAGVAQALASASL
ncbi:MAG: tRNA 2-thiouridine(34) synthase MnmA [Pseudomonadota bacterium]